MDRVLVADKLAPEGMAILQAAVDAGQLQVDERIGLKPDELARAIGDVRRPDRAQLEHGHRARSSTAAPQPARHRPRRHRRRQHRRRRGDHAAASW